MSIYTVTLLMGTKYSPEWAYNSLFNQSCLNGHLRRFFIQDLFFCNYFKQCCSVFILLCTCASSFIG